MQWRLDLALFAPATSTSRHVGAEMLATHWSLWLGGAPGVDAMSVGIAPTGKKFTPGTPWL